MRIQTKVREGKEITSLDAKTLLDEIKLLQNEVSSLTHKLKRPRW